LRHIKSLKDVKTLKLTPNPAPSTSSATATNTSTDRPRFVCPLTLKEMNGVQPFVYIATCGCVLSQAGLKALTATSGSSTPPADRSVKAEDKEEDKESQLEICPQCATKYDKREDVRVINPDPETEAVMRAAMDARRLKQKVPKSKKRKAESSDASALLPEGEDAAGKVKKAKTSTPAPSMNPTIAAASRAVVSSLAMEEAKRKAGMSDAVKSLYESNDKNRKETFMTRGTFTRYA